MTTAQVVETSVTVNNNSPIQDYVHPDDQTQPTFEMTPGFKPFTVVFMLLTPQKLHTKAFTIRESNFDANNVSFEINFREKKIFKFAHVQMALPKKEI